MEGLAGKRVVVTGGTSGIGAATAQRFRDEGCEVVVLARTPGPGVIPCDVGDREQVDRAFDQIGSLDVLVNNAGMSFRSPAVDISAGQWDRVVATNLSGPSGWRRPRRGACCSATAASSSSRPRPTPWWATATTPTTTPPRPASWR